MYRLTTNLLNSVRTWVRRFGFVRVRHIDGFGLVRKLYVFSMCVQVRFCSSQNVCSSSVRSFRVLFDSLVITMIYLLCKLALNVLEVKVEVQTVC